MRSEQLSIFEVESEKKLFFHGSIQNDRWETETEGVKKLVVCNDLELSKTELKEICRKANNVKRRNYGFTVFYVEKGINKEVFVRFKNETTSSKVDVFGFIDMYFDEMV